MKDYIESLREEYKGLGLTDEQIITAKSNNINPEQIRKFIEIYKNIGKTLTDVWEEITRVMREFTESQSFKELIEISQDSSKIKRNSKGKQLKPWEKKMFFN